VQLQKTNVVEFVRQCVEQLQPLAAPKQVRLIMQEPADGAIAGEIDPDQLDKVVTNLVTNAIRHAPKSGEVLVRVERVEDEEAPAWTLTVRDDGPGVPSALRERIFDPFFQAPGATEGMGLGLALSRDVVVLHKGQIRVLEDGPGATFQVRLPLEARRRERKVAAESVFAVADETDAARSPAEVASALAPQAPAGRAGRARVLVVEDDPGLCRFLAEQLGDAREVRTAMQGEEALRVLRSWSADAIVSDVVMPGIDGFALCRILKADPMTRNIPVVLLTARGAREDQLTGLGAGADDYLVKPFDPAQLRMKVDNLIRLRSSIEDRFRRALPAWSAILLRAGAEDLDRPSEQFLERLYQELTARIPDQGFDVEQLARALNLSRASLYRRVKELLDTTPLDLLMHMRLEQAALLLRTEDETIARIAHRCGFKWAPTFTVRFTSHFGMTPSAYRALHRPAGGPGGNP
jgi:DNA-binding response OmpR family regulator